MVQAKTTKKLAGVFKKEIEKGGGLLGQLIDEKFGHLFEDPTVRDLAYRVIGFGIESLESAFPGDHPLLGPGTSTLSDLLEQATPFFVGEQRGTATKKGKRSKGSDAQTPTTKQPDWIDEWWKAARIRMSKAIKGGGVDFDATDFAQLLRDEFDILWGIHQKMVELSTPDEPESIPDYDGVIVKSVEKILKISDDLSSDEFERKCEEASAYIHKKLGRIADAEKFRNDAEERVEELRAALESKKDPVDINDRISRFTRGIGDWGRQRLEKIEAKVKAEAETEADTRKETVR